MNNNKPNLIVVKRVVISLFFSIVFYLLGNWLIRNTSFVSVEVDVKTTSSADLVVCYSTQKDVYVEKYQAQSYVSSKDQYSTITVSIPEQRNFQSFRFNWENVFIGTTVSIREIRIKNLFSTIVFKGTDILKYFKANKHTLVKKSDSNGLVFQIISSEPRLKSKVDMSSFDEGRLYRYYNRNFGYGIDIIITFIVFIILFRTLKLNNHNDVRVLAEKFTVGLFFIIIAIPSLFLFSIPSSNISKGENRVLNPLPNIIVDVQNFPKNFTDWFNDHFAWRESLISLNSTFHFLTFGKKSELDQKVVIEGKEKDWLFYCGGNVLNEGYLNKVPFTDLEIAYITERINEKSEWLRERNVDFYLMIVPNKETIYPEYLPAGYNPENNPNRTDQILEALAKNYPNVKFSDSRKLLKKSKKAGLLYFPADSHWNMRGAIYAYHDLIDLIAKDYPDFYSMDPNSLEYTKKLNPNGSDLDRMLNGHVTIKREDFIPTLGAEYQINIVTTNTTYPEDTLCKFTSMLKINPVGGKKRKIIIFRDSFSNTFIDFLAQQADTTIALWTHQFMPNTVEKEKPNIVVHEILERFLYEYLDQAPLDPTKKAFSKKEEDPEKM
ncbi:MAG: alginate O-acetyltransferase AlgX-related protein [Bacteroidia bacterium]